MTGYGRGEVRGATGFFTIELRSVNNRFIDIQTKLPRELSALEPRFRKAVQDRFSRGRFELFVLRNGGAERAVRFRLNTEAAEQYLGALRDIKARFNLPGEVDLSLLAGMQDVIVSEDVKEDAEALWAPLSAGLTAALDALETMRSEEGAALAADIIRRLQEIETRLQEIRSRSHDTVEAARTRLAETLRKLLAEPPDPARLAQEIAFLAERTDITEELTRLDSHLHQFRSLVRSADAESVGRKLEFLLQEMGREANTIASKSQNAGIASGVVTIKAELEKIREQVQNIE